MDTSCFHALSYVMDSEHPISHLFRQPAGPAKKQDPVLTFRYEQWRTTSEYRDVAIVPRGNGNNTTQLLLTLWRELMEELSAVAL